MNTTAAITTKTLTYLAAVFAAAFMLHTSPAQAAPKTDEPVVVQLPRVVVTGQRIDRAAAPMKIVELPRVVITARRTDITRVVQAPAVRPV